MAGPIASKVILPDDSGNAGKKVRTQTRVVGADTVHEHFFIQARQAEVLGVYRYAQAQNTVLAAAQTGNTSGMLYGHVPAATVGKAARLRRMAVTSQHSTALATPTAPRLLLQRLTASAALTTTLQTPSKVLTSAPTPVLLLSPVVTGLTSVTLVGTANTGLGSAALAGALTAVGAYEPCFKDIIDPASDEDEWPLFVPGEGFVLWQDTAGTATDTRKFNVQMLWDEIDVS